jgi:hypothetical protein
VEPLKLPDDAVLVIVEKTADALRMVPGAYVLKPEKYRELLEAAKRRVDRPATPSHCELKGKAEGGVLSLRATFDFRTDQPRSSVRIACRDARAYDVALDGGRKPLLHYDPSDGFSVNVDKPGEHHLTVDFAVAIGPRETGRGFEVELPRAASTKLAIELPAGSRDLRLDHKLLADPLLEFKDNILKGSLPASAERLDLSWSGATVGPGALTARGRLQVRLDEKQATTEAELLLKREGGEADTWKILVPAGAEVKPGPGDEEKLAGIDSDDKTYGPFASLRTVRLKAAAAFVKLLVTARGPQIRGGASVPVGPCWVPGAVRQEGTILVSNLAPGQRLDFQRRGDVTRRTASTEESQNDPALVAVFHYWGVPVNERPSALTGPGSLSILDIDAEAVRGLVEARVTHAVQLSRSPSGGRYWHLKTRIEATPVRSGVEQMRVQLPPGFQYTADPGFAGLAVEKANVLSFRLTGAEAKSFALNVEGDYAGSVGETGRTTLLLPRPLDTSDLGGQVTLSVPEDLEMIPIPGANQGLESTARDVQTQAWRSTAFPERVEVAWRPSRHEPQVAAEADVTLTPGEVHVRHTMRFHFPRAAPEQVALRVPPAVGSRLRVVRGGNLSSAEFLGPSLRTVDLRVAREPSPGRDVTLVLEYSSVRPVGQDAETPLSIPLVHPDMATAGEIKVRVWSEPGQAPLPPGGAWAEQNVEEVQGRDRLPALVLRAQNPGAQLALPLTRAETPAVSVLTERVLVRAYVTEGGGQTYRVGFLLDGLDAHYLDVELPAPTAGLGLRITLDGKQVTWEGVDEEGRHAPAGRIARLRLGPQLVKRGSILEVAYELPAGRATTGILQTTLVPPFLRADPGRVPTRWLVCLPPGWVALGPEGGLGQEREWTRRGWLLVPGPAVHVADLERWLVGPEAATTAVIDDATVPALTCWRDRPEPLRVTHAPQQGWLLACSLATLAVGLSLLPLARLAGGLRFSTWFLPIGALVGAFLAVATLFWPATVATTIYGCEPGVAVLGVALPLLWIQFDRRRRTFQSSFSRGRAASSSSLQQRAAGPRESGEPSTVDVTRPNGSVPRLATEVPRLEGSSSGSASRQPQGSGGPGS